MKLHLLWLCALVLCSNALQASSFHSDYREKFKAADLVVIGKTISIHNRDESAAGQVNVFTDITIEVIRVLKGKTNSSNLVLTFAGGWHDSQYIELSGSSASQFEVGDQDLLFISNSKVMPVDDDSKLPIVDGDIYDSRGNQFVLADGKMKRIKGLKKIKNTVKIKDPKSGTELVLGFESNDDHFAAPNPAHRSDKNAKTAPMDIDSFTKEISKGGRP